MAEAIDPAAMADDAMLDDFQGDVVVVINAYDRESERWDMHRRENELKAARQRILDHLARLRGEVARLREAHETLARATLRCTGYEEPTNPSDDLGVFQVLRRLAKAALAAPAPGEPGKGKKP